MGGARVSTLSPGPSPFSLFWVLVAGVLFWGSVCVGGELNKCPSTSVSEPVTVRWHGEGCPAEAVMIWCGALRWGDCP